MADSKTEYCNILKSIYYKKLKGLDNITINFSEKLTAIMGVNGIGKSTILHSLACLYQPQRNGQSYNFVQFFPSNPDALWQGSEFTVSFDISNLTNPKLNTRVYSKKTDRWTPRLDNRPKRDIFYIGINTCNPEIEKKNIYSYVGYTTKTRTGKQFDAIVKDASYILQMDYDELTDNENPKNTYIGVKRKSGLKYSSLTMGAGEQRTLKILELIYTAPDYSLILIDEIDLLLHESALRKLIEKLYSKATEKHIQIVFTTHSMVMKDLTKYVDIQYLSKELGLLNVYQKMTTDIQYNLTNKVNQDIHVFVEDELSKAILKSICSDLNIRQRCKICIFGASSNAFTLASSFAITDADISNIRIILDGDVYPTDESKIEQLKKHLSGTDTKSSENRNKALSCISQYQLPENTAPEKFLHSLLLENGDSTNEIIRAAGDINAVTNSHDWINNIKERLDESEEVLVNNIVSIVKTNPKWENYIKPVKDWLLEASKK